MNYDNDVIDPSIPVSAKATIEPGMMIDMIPKDRQFRMVIDKFEPLNIAPALPMLCYIRVGTNPDFGYWRMGGTRHGDLATRVYLGTRAEAILCKIEPYSYIYKHKRAQSLVRIMIRQRNDEMWVPLEIGPSGALAAEEIKPYEHYEPTYANPDVFSVGMHPNYKDVQGIVLKHDVMGLYLEPNMKPSRDGSDQYVIQASGEIPSKVQPIFIDTENLRTYKGAMKMRSPNPIAVVNPIIPAAPFFPERMPDDVYTQTEDASPFTQTSYLYGKWQPRRGKDNWLAQSFARNAMTPFTTK